MHWEPYSARDHERSRPYVVAGMNFFARLSKNLVLLAKQPWVSDKERLVRELKRGSYNIYQQIQAHAMGRFHDEIELPPMISAEEMAEKWERNAPDMKGVVSHGYEHLRQKQSWATDKSGNMKD